MRRKHVPAPKQSPLVEHAHEFAMHFGPGPQPLWQLLH
jgi:hypothetical protein